MAIIDTLEALRVTIDVIEEDKAHVALIPAEDDPTDWRRSVEIATLIVRLSAMCQRLSTERPLKSREEARQPA